MEVCRIILRGCARFDLRVKEADPDEHHLCLSACDKAARQDVALGDALVCPHCGNKIIPPTKATDGRRVTRCLVCPSTDLYVRKDFPQRVGVGLVAVGIVGSSIAWGFSQIYLTYGILFATALLDLLLYWIVPNA